MGSVHCRPCEAEDIRAPTLVNTLGVEVAAKMASARAAPGFAGDIPGFAGDMDCLFPSEPAIPRMPAVPAQLADVAMPTFGVRISGVPSRAAGIAPLRRVSAGVLAALRFGCRHVDCSEAAGIADAEIGIGNALLSLGAADATEAQVDTRGHAQTSSLTLFVASSPPPDAVDARRPELLREACSATLANLGLQRLGLYILPARSCLAGSEQLLSEEDLQCLWPVMEALVLERKVSLIGIADVLPAALSRLLSWCKVQPAVHQIEAHPYRQQRALLDFHSSRSILTECRSPCGFPVPRNGAGPEAIAQLAAARGVQPQALALAWAAARGTVALVDLPPDPPSGSGQQLAQVADALCEASRLELTEAELQAIAALDAEGELPSFSL